MREGVKPMHIIFALTLLVAFGAGGMLAVAENSRLERMEEMMVMPAAAVPSLSAFDVG